MNLSLGNQQCSPEPAPVSRLEAAVGNVHGTVSELEYVLIDLEKKLSRVLDASTTTIGADKADQQTKDNSITSDVNSASDRISALYHRTKNIIDRLHV